MSPSKVLTVFGATGNQGGSVVAAVLSDSKLSAEYQLRGITRDPSKPNAQKLVSQGVKMVTADMNDTESLKSAISGSYAVFAVTNYWETMSKATEVQQGKNIADVSVATGVKHLIWANLPHVAKLTNGELKHVAHFDGKAEVGEYIDSIKGETSMVTTHWMPGFFMSNLKGMISLNEAGIPVLKLPFDAKKTQVALLDVVGDTGKFVVGALLGDPQKYNGFHIQGVSQWLTPTEIVDTLSRVSGKKVDFVEVPANVYTTFLPEAIAEEMTENMLLIRDWSYYGKGAEKQQSHSDVLLQSAKTSWEEYAKRNGPWEWT